MRRRLFTFCSALSLMMFVATGSLWARSYWVADVWAIRPAPSDSAMGLSSVRSAAGIIVLVRQRPDLATYPTPARWRTVSPAGRALVIWGPDLREWELLGVTYYRLGTALSALHIPYWMPVAATTILPWVWLFGWIDRRARDRVGRCRTCGYDLRATPDRCPECGTAALAR